MSLGTFAERFLLLCAGLLWVVGAQDSGRVATFFGGQFRVNLRTQDRFLTVNLNFRTLQDTGVLFVARLEDNSGYFTLGLSNRQLIAIIKHDIITERLTVGYVNSSTWQGLTLLLRNRTLNISLNSHPAIGHVLSSAIGFKDIYFGGPHTFFAGLYTDLTITEYFVGCLGNVSVMNKLVDFVVQENEYGIQLGCCPNPSPPSWCFGANNSSLRFRAVLNHVRFSELFNISMKIHAHGNGIVLFSHADLNDIAFEVHNSTLRILLRSKTQVYVVHCPGVVTSRNWYSLVVKIDLNRLTCSLDGESNHMELSLQTLPVVSQFFIGSPTIDVANDSQILGSLRLQPSGGRLNSFMGCIEKLQFNNIDVNLGTLQDNAPTISEVCLSPSPPPSPSLPPVDCQTLEDENIQWEDLSINTVAVPVNETSQATISTTHLEIQLPVNDSLITEQIHNATTLYVTQGPLHGFFADMLKPDIRIVSFSYSDVRQGRVVYFHGGEENGMDLVVLDAVVACGEHNFWSENITLQFTVFLQNDFPEVLRRSEMHIAMGTRRVITPNIITVVDADSSSPSQIIFTVLGIGIDRCGLCTGNEVGRIERTADPGFEHVFFTQEDVNLGFISFQHFAHYGTDGVTIYVRVQDPNGAAINTHIEVKPHQAHINLTTNECLFVVEGTEVVLRTRHLNTTTTFEEQDPVVTYDIVTPPRYGRLEVQVRYDPRNESAWDWEPISRQRNANSFTQRDIDNNQIRYVHSNSVQPIESSDMFQFHLRSTNLTGPAGNFCIQVLSYEALQQPSIVVNVGNISVLEGGSVVIDETVLNSSLSPPILIEWLEEEIGIEKLEITYVLQQRPAHGEFKLDGRPLINDSFTLSDIRSDLVKYIHWDSENHTDSFVFFAESRNSLNLPIRSPDRTPSMEANILITPVNDNKPVLTAGEVLVPEGGWVRITSAMIRIEDADLPKDTISVLLRNPKPSNPGEIPNGHFALGNRTMNPVRSFTMQDILDAQVIFVHHLNSTAPLSYVQYLRVDDGEHTVRLSITVTATPLTVLASAVNLPNNSRCFAELDATTETLSVPLYRDSFDISVNDPNGNDPNRIFHIIVTVATAPEFGQILRTSSNDTPIDLFHGHDLFNGVIIYRFSDSTAITTNDTFYLTFQYGHGSSGRIPFSVCIRHIPVPTLKRVGFVYLARGSVVSINTTHLLATDTRGGLNHSLHYEITQGPRHGILFNQSSDDSNVHLENFTQEDVNKNHIAYNHRDMMTSNLSDSFLFKVCALSAPPDNEASTRYACTRVHTFNFSIHVVNLTVINTGFEVEEGDSFSIGKTELNAIPPPGYYVEFHILSVPKHGEIHLRDFPESELNYFQHRDLVNRRIVYVHQEQETLHDSFEFLVVAETDDLSVDLESRRLEVRGVVNITVLPVNNWDPEFVKREVLVVVTGGFAVISSSILKAHDSDSDMRDEDLVYDLVAPSPFYGGIYFEEAPNVTNISQWTEGDLRLGRVFYKHFGTQRDIRNDLIIFHITDGKRVQTQTLPVDVRKIILKNVAPRRDTFNVMEGLQAVITQEYLQYNATNDQRLLDEHYIYIIQAYPLYGTLLFNNVTATSFTQQDLETGRLVYAHDNSNTVRDSFNFTITVPIRKNAVSDVYEFPIRIIPIDDDAPKVVGIERPLFVVERQTVEIGSTEIEIYDLDSQTVPQAINITCTLIDGPHYGLIQYYRFSRFFENPVDFTNFDLLRDEVVYNHTILGHWNDYFVFNLTDQINPQNETYRVDIVILPWIVPLNISEVMVREGGAVVFEQNDFEVLHPHLSEVFGCITVTRQPYHGSLVNATTGSRVGNFTTLDLKNGSIVYRHVGDESKNDSFWFVYDAHEPTGHERRSNDTQFPIVILPVNDEPPVLRTYEGTAQLWVGQTIVLDQTYLSATDHDTPPETLRYNYTLNIDGIITYSDSQSGRSIQSFTQADVDAERVIFRHISEFHGTLVFTVTDGIQSSHGQIDISAHELRLTCNQAANLSVSMQGSVTITREQLLCTTNDYNSPTPREIFYNVRELEYGKILVGSVETARFNQSDVNAGLVVYSHTDLDRWESEEVPIVSVETPLAVNTPAVVLSIHISHPSTPDSSLAVNTGLEVVEGGRACLNESVLDARNLRYSAWNDFRHLFATVHELSSVLRLTSLPQHGKITINGEEQLAPPISFNQTFMATGSVCYYHDGSDTLTDSLPFQLTIESISDSSSTFNDSSFVESLNVSVTPVNDELPYLVTTELNITVVDGFVYTFVPEVLKIQDQDSPPEELEYVITSVPGNGELVVRNSTIRAGERFKQATINDGLLKFKPRGVAHGNFSFTFNDIDHMSENSTRFDVSVVDHDLKLLSNKEATATYKQNEGGVTITTDLLNTSTNGIRGETQFVVKNVPAHGVIVGPSDPNRFTQAEVDSGVVRYRNTDFSFHNDSLKVCIVNRKVNYSDVVILIRVVVWGEVKTQEELDFTSELSLPLSSDLLNLDQLQSTLHRPPMIEVISPPRYGYLKFNYVTTVRKRSPARNNEQFSFRYDELKAGWVFYTWNSTENYTVIDKMTVLVQASGAGLQPGEAEISITVHPPATTPATPSPPTSPDTTNTLPPSTSTGNPPREDFPMYALIPILGIFFILIIMIAVVVVFCLTQQKRIRMKWQPKVASTNHPYPWSVPPTTVPRPAIPTQYDFDPTTSGGGEIGNEDNSETSSGFSEPITPTRHSPNHPRLSPTYSNPPPPRSRIGRVHSSVSITLLNRSSVSSDASLEDHSYFSRPQQQPPKIAVPIPIRPVSHSLVRRTSRGTVESGYSSTKRSAAETLTYTSNSSKQEVPTPSEMSISANPSPLPPSESGIADMSSIEGCTSYTTAAPVSSSNELLEPELLKLFRSSPPLLKKHEYWV